MVTQPKIVKSKRTICYADLFLFDKSKFAPDAIFVSNGDQGEVLRITIGGLLMIKFDHLPFPIALSKEDVIECKP